MWRMILNSNELKSRLMTVVGTLILLAASAEAQDPKRQIVVSIPDRKLALLEDGEVKKIYPVAVGKEETPSPAGEFEIVNRLTNPTYYKPGTIVGPGASNPLGTRWIGLNQKGYGIHGTNAPKSIGKAASHGCIRMAKKDLEELFTLVKVGDTVQIRAEKDDELAAIFGGSPDRMVVAQAQTAQGAVGQ